MVEILIDRQKLPGKTLDGGDKASVASVLSDEKTRRRKFIGSVIEPEKPGVLQWANA